MKVITTPQLRKLIARAVELDLNRKGPYGIMQRIDPDGKHVLNAVMMHNDCQVRCHILTKLSNRSKPSATELDVTLEDFNALPDYHK